MPRSERFDRRARRFEPEGFYLVGPEGLTTTLVSVIVVQTMGKPARSMRASIREDTRVGHSEDPILFSVRFLARVCAQRGAYEDRHEQWRLERNVGRTVK